MATKWVYMFTEGNADMRNLLEMCIRDRCMTMRGIKKPGSKTVSVVTRGAFEENEKLQNMFFRMIG